MNPFEERETSVELFALSTGARDADRQDVLKHTLFPLVQAWSQRYQLEELWQSHPQPAHKRLYACAFSGLTRTLDPQHMDHAWLLACFSWWVSVLDHYLDHDLVSFLRTQHWPLAQQQAYLQDQLAYIAAPLAAPTASYGQPVASLPESQQRAMLLLREALSSLSAHVQHRLAHCVDEEQRLFASTTVHNELIRFMQGQYRDVCCTLHYHTTHQPPDDLEVYLEQMRDGVGLRALAALSLASEAATTDAQSWHDWSPALERGSDVIRLVNDCGGFLREQSEEKPNSVTIALTLLGYTLTHDALLTSAPVKHALQLVYARIDTEHRAFQDIVSPLIQAAPSTSLSYCILSAVTTITKLYQTGADYEVPHDHP